MLIKFWEIAFIILFSLSLGLNTSAQNQGIKLEDIDKYATRLGNCEQYSVDIDYLTNNFSALVEENNFLILVARLGSGETNRRFNQRRLHNLREAIIYNGIDANKIVAAEGEKVRGLGRVEVYFSGKLINIFPVKRNRDICVDCCGPDNRFYGSGKFEPKIFQKQKSRKKSR